MPPIYLLCLLFGFLICLLFADSLSLTKRCLENFVENYKTVTRDAFPCPKDAVSDVPGMSGCYYHELAGCAMFPDTAGITTCPPTPAELDQKLKTASADVSPANTSIFDYIYDKLNSNKTSASSCPEAPCENTEFFRKMQVMTDAELSAYLQRIKDNECSVGAICLRPENVASYISDSQILATSQGKTCEDVKASLGTIANESSKQLIHRIYPDCDFSQTQTQTS